MARLLELKMLTAQMTLDQHAAQTIFRQLGFQREGVLREYEFVKEKFVDLTMYSLLRREQIKKSE